MKLMIVISLFFSNILYAQYLGTDLSDADLDPRPLVKDLGNPPLNSLNLNVDTSRRNKKELERGPAVIKEEEINNSLSK